MKATIAVDIDESHTLRGMHNWSGTITFTYDGASHNTEWEQAVVDAITQKWVFWAWRTITPPTDDSRRWTVNYGYDSGD